MYKLIHAIVIVAAAVAVPGRAQTPLTKAAQDLIATKGPLRYTTYGEMDLAPAKVFRDERRTYIQLREAPGQKVEALEVTPIGYRRLPSNYEAPYLVVGGFAPSMAISYPGRKLVFLEFGAETVRVPASEAELQIRLRERAKELLDEQTRTEAMQRDILTKARVERERTEAAKAEAQREQAQLAAMQQSISAQRAEIAKRLEPVKTFDVWKNDLTLKGVLGRWAANDGLELVWSAPDSANAEVAGDGRVDAQSLKEAVNKLLLAFKGREVFLEATIYSNGVIEVTQKKAGQQ